jgi:hypothetical protein
MFEDDFDLFSDRAVGSLGGGGRSRVVEAAAGNFQGGADPLEYRGRSRSRCLQSFGGVGRGSGAEDNRGLF